MKYVKSKVTDTIFEVVFQGENYVFGTEKGKPRTYGYSATLLDGKWGEWTDEPQVGDKVRVKGDIFTYDLLYIHDGGETYNGEKWAVYAYGNDRPYSRRLSELEKVDG